jgi:hypothetical protein
MAVKKKEAKTAVSATGQRSGVKWCKHGINEKFCISCKKPVKEEVKKAVKEEVKK